MDENKKSSEEEQELYTIKLSRALGKCPEVLYSGIRLKFVKDVKINTIDNGIECCLLLT